MLNEYSYQCPNTLKLSKIKNVNTKFDVIIVSVLAMNSSKMCNNSDNLQFLNI